MRADRYNVGGEPSGHIILADYATTGDGLIAALQLLAVLVGQDRPVSALAHCFTPVPQTLRNVRCDGTPLDDGAVQAAIAAVERRLGAGGRVVVRPSGTEPVIRIMVEAEDGGLMAAAVEDIAQAIAKVAPAPAGT
jgi:phosphoglucosamine mutase